MPLSPHQVSAILGRAKVFARGLCVGLQQEFEYLRALLDWYRKLRMARVVCWALETVFADQSPKWASSQIAASDSADDAAARCRPWVQLCLKRIDDELTSLQSWLAPGIERRNSRYSAERAMVATFSIYRVMSDVAGWLESAQAETGASYASREDCNDLLLPLPSSWVADPFQLLAQSLRETVGILERGAPLDWCMATRNLWCEYLFAMTIAPARCMEEGWMQTVISMHRDALQRTEALQNGGERYSSSAQVPKALIDACAHAHRHREALLCGQDRPDEGRFGDHGFLKQSRPQSGVGEICSKPLLFTFPIRLLFVGSASLSIEQAWDGEFQIDRADRITSASIDSYDLIVGHIGAYESAGLNFSNRSGVRTVLISDDNRHPSHFIDGREGVFIYQGSWESIDRHFVYVYLTGGVSANWYQETLAQRREEALKSLTTEWLIESYLLPEFPVTQNNGDVLEFKSLTPVNAVRDLLLADLRTVLGDSSHSSNFSNADGRSIYDRDREAELMRVISRIESMVNRESERVYKVRPVQEATAWRPLIRKYGLTGGSLQRRIRDISKASGAVFASARPMAASAR